jgi:putative transposase
MDGKGRAIDNIFIERLWRTVKYDYVYPNPPQDGWQLKEGLTRFFQHYNYQKYHQGINRQPPANLYYGTSNGSA